LVGSQETTLSGERLTVTSIELVSFGQQIILWRRKRLGNNKIYLERTSFILKNLGKISST